MLRLLADPTERTRLVHPVLLWESGPVDAAAVPPEWEFTSPGQPAPPRPRAGEPVLFEVVKSAASLNAMLGVTVGRTPNNDLVVHDPSVSRFHAWFQRDERTAQWQLVDAGSSNGTFVNGARLEGSKPVKLDPDAQLRFGDVKVRFLEASRLLPFLDTLK